MEVLVESPCSMGMLIPVETVEGRWSKHKTRGVSKNWVYPQCMASFLDVYLEKMVINDQFGGVPPFSDKPRCYMMLYAMIPWKSSQAFQVWLVFMPLLLLFQQGVPNLIELNDHPQQVLCKIPSGSSLWLIHCCSFFFPTFGGENPF